MKVKSKGEVYGSFYVGELEVAISVNSLQEVVNLPAQIIKMPLAPDFLVGVFNLRGVIIPVINLKSLLQLSERETRPDQKIGIVDFKGAKVGLLFDAAHEILRIREDELNEFSYGKDLVHQVISGALKLENGSRIIQIIDPFALINIENIPQIIDQQNKINSSLKALQLGNRKKCISFSASGMKLGIEITTIHEIIKVPEIKPSAIKHELCLGMVNQRGHIVPIIDLSLLLGEPRSINEYNEDQRIIVLKINKEIFGLLVDDVESISTYREDEIMPIPLLTNKRTQLFLGCAAIPDIGNVILLNCSQMFSHDEILEITQGHSKIYQSTSEVETIARKGNRQTYISFKLNYLLGVSIKEVREIINYTSDICKAPGMPAFVRGVLNLRGALITIIDTRALYTMDAAESITSEINDSEKTKILIFESHGERFGLIVDSVENIISVDENKKMKVPSLMVQKAAHQFKNDIAEIITYQQEENKEGVIIILDMVPLTSRIMNTIAA